MSIKPFWFDEAHFGPYVDDIQRQHRAYLEAKETISTSWHHYIGVQTSDSSVLVREYAPQAEYVSIFGEFNHWDRACDPLERQSDGTWVTNLDRNRITNNSKYKLHIAGYNGARDRLPSTAKYSVQTEHGDYASVFNFTSLSPVTSTTLQNQDLNIYEVHIGLAANGPHIGTYRELADNIVPYIARCGYTCVQLMGVHEHPYYGSFGYHVSNPFGVCSRFGSPHDFKYLVDTCHANEIKVIIDLVHAHAVKNLDEGLGEFDGREGYLFQPYSHGLHPAWDSLVYDYSSRFTQTYLLSNVRYWLEEYGIDGFRVDGVTSILYADHGIARSGFELSDYYSENVNTDGLLYLRLLNHVSHCVRQTVITIAEDVSGMPGLARPLDEQGIGFDYRLQMGLPDFFENHATRVLTEGLSPSALWQTLISRRLSEKHVAYIESHDQSIVGGQSLIFRMLGKQMYSDMSIASKSHTSHLAISMINIWKLVTKVFGGESWLTFVGNEFGHPEWVDFPTPANNDSFAFAYRKWFLRHDANLLYSRLAAFDDVLMHLEATQAAWGEIRVTAPLVDDCRQLLVLHRAGLVCVMNLHPTQSYEDVWIPIPVEQDHSVVITTDEAAFGGHGRVDTGKIYPWLNEGTPYIRIYVPSASAILFTSLH